MRRKLAFDFGPAVRADGTPRHTDPIWRRTCHLQPHLLNVLEISKSLLGKEVWVDYSKVPNHKTYPHIRDTDEWDGKPFRSVVVAINRINSSQNGDGNNRGEVEIMPDHIGNWASVDLRMLTVVEK